MWGYTKINETYRLCDRCGAVVGDTEKHTQMHTNFIGDDTPIYELNLPLRAYAPLRSYGITTVERLMADIDKDHAHLWLQDFRGIGYKTAEQAFSVLQKHGIVDTSGRIVKD